MKHRELLAKVILEPAEIASLSVAQLYEIEHYMSALLGEFSAFRRSLEATNRRAESEQRLAKLLGSA